jgi:hypothetical protein
MDLFRGTSISAQLCSIKMLLYVAQASLSPDASSYP